MRERALQRLTGVMQWGNRALMRLEEKKTMRAAGFAALLVVIAAGMFLLNLHTPLMMDDYDYSFSWSTGQRIAGLGDIAASQAAHYKLWGGRSVVHAIAQFFLSMDKMVFNVANTLMYLLLLLQIYAIAKPAGRRFCWPLLLCAHAALFTCVPYFGTVFLWLTGSCNYLWGTVLALTPILIQRSMRSGGMLCRGALSGVLAAIVSFLAGWTNENTACGVIAVVFLMLLWQWAKGERVRKRQWLSLLAQIAGAAVMLLAPGNFARASSYEAGNMLLELLRRVVMATAYGVVYVGVLLIAALLLAAICKALGVKRRVGDVLILLVGAAGAAYAMIASPVFSDRSWTGVFVLALCAALTLLGDLDEQIRDLDCAKLCALPLCVLLMAYGSYQALSSVKAHEAAWLEQVSRIEAAAQAGETQVTVQSVPSHSRFTMPIALEADALAWPNSTLSKAFGVNVNAE